VRGRFPVLTKTYFDFNGPNAAADGIKMLGALSYGMAVSPDGKWLHNLEKTGTCFQLSSTKRPGLVLRTPYLAARITNVKYQPRMVVRLEPCGSELLRQRWCDRRHRAFLLQPDFGGLRVELVIEMWRVLGSPLYR
jgi:hypothetical protein